MDGGDDRDDEVASLLSTLAGWSDRGGRVEAVRQLGLRRERRAVSALLEMLAYEEDYRVLETIIWALGEIGDPAAIPALIRCAMLGRWIEVRQRAVRTLRHFHDPRVEDFFISQLSATDWYIRWWSIQGLGEVGGVKAIQALLALLRGEEALPADTVNNQILRSFAAGSLGEIGDPVGLPYLLEELHGPISQSIGAVYGLGRLGDTRAIPGLLAFLERIETALATLGDHRSPAADNERYGLQQYRLNTAVALGRLGSAQGLKYLLELFCDEIDVDTIDEFEEVVDALVRLHQTQIIPRLRACLEIPVPEEEEDEHDVVRRMHRACTSALERLERE